MLLSILTKLKYKEASCFTQSSKVVFTLRLIYLDFFTPYFERPHDLFFTPAASKVPRTI